MKSERQGVSKGDGGLEEGRGDASSWEHKDVFLRE